MSSNPWSLYWQQNQLHSCLESGNTGAQQLLESIWKQLASNLAEDAKVLDLATGNGAVPSLLLKHSPNLKIDAVDKAKINPNQHYHSNPLLTKVVFRGNIDIVNLPFLVNSFDAITSQFGIEYAGLEQATEAATPLLKENGLLVFIVHHHQSEVIKASKVKLIEIKELLKEGGLIEKFSAYLQKKLNRMQLEKAGQEFIDSNCQKSDQISGQIFAIIEQSIQKQQLGDGHVAETLDMQLRAQQQRLEQLLSVAQSEAKIEEYKAELAKHNLQIKQCKPVYAQAEQNSELIAWYISAIKKNKT